MCERINSDVVIGLDIIMPRHGLCPGVSALHGGRRLASLLNQCRCPSYLNLRRNGIIISRWKHFHMKEPSDA